MIKNEPEDIKRRQEKLYGIYRGVVEDNDDSSAWMDDNRWNSGVTGKKGGTGRVKVRVWGIHTKDKTKSDSGGVPTEELPWAEPAFPIMEGSISGVGLWSVPVQGTHVFLFFENGDHMQPRYFALAPGIEPEEKVYESGIGFEDKDKVYPLQDFLNEPDYNRLARGIRAGTYLDTRDNSTDEGGIIGTEPFSDYNAEYPHNMVLKTHGGIVLELDSTPDNERINIWHPSNSYVEISKNGRFIIKSSGEMYYISGSDRTGYINADDAVIVTGDRTVEITGNWDVTCNDCDITVGGDCNIDVTGICNVKASMINLN